MVAAVVTGVSHVTLADVTYTLRVSDDAFCRVEAPTLNYGGAGLLCVAGAESVNVEQQPRGRFDALMRFDSAPFVNELDLLYGMGQWRIVSMRLEFHESGAPNNPLFPRGAGRVRVDWLSNDNWSEGGGTPNLPQPGTDNVLTWQWLTEMLSTSQQVMLAELPTTGADTRHELSLPLEPQFVSDWMQSGPVTLLWSPVTDTLGFSFHSRTFGDGGRRPRLTLQARILRDSDCNNIVDEWDAVALAVALVDPSAYLAQYPMCSLEQADVTGDGIVDGDDLELWIQLQR